MEFKSIEYMEWAKQRNKGAIDLSRSGVEGLSFEDLGLSLEGLDINGDHPYGYAPLIEAIAAKYGVREENVVPLIGASQAVFFACAAVLDRGDRVLIEKPAYEPLLSCARVLEAEVMRFERRFETGYQVDIDEFKKSLSQRTKLVVLTNLHNPSGAFLSQKQVQALAEAALEKGARVFIDEIYLDFMEEERSRSAFGAAENIFIASSLTKVYGLSGFRCGWILAAAPLAEKMRRMIDYLFVEHVFVGEQLAARTFPLLDTLREKNRRLIENNRRMVKQFIEEEPLVEWVEPAGGIVGFPRVKGAFDGDALAKILREGYATSVVPGRFFEEPRHFRIGFGVPSNVLAQGLANIKMALPGSNLHI